MPVSTVNIAVDAAFPAMTKLLLSMGGNANELDSTQKPVLAHALASSDNGEGQHAFYYAGVHGAHAEGDEATAMPANERASRRFTKIARKLVRHGASCDFVDMYGWAPIHYAAQCSDAKIVRMIAERAGAAAVAAPITRGLGDPHSMGLTALHLALHVYNGFFDAPPVPQNRAAKLRVLLELGAASAIDVIAQGSSALMDAAHIGDVECIDVLLGAGANAAARGSDGMTAADKLARHAARPGATAAQAALKKLRRYESSRR